MNYGEAYEFGAGKLKASDIDEYKIDARLLLEFVCKTDASALLSHPEREVTSDEFDEYCRLIAERKSHIPLQHLLGTTWFMGLEFFVSKDVLIPRQDTECLVEEVMKNLHDGMRILDMCTGSGCILLSLLHYSNGCTGVGADVSNAALGVALKNASKLSEEGLIEKTAVEFTQSDLFENITGTFDVLVSNPPYIETAEIDKLMPEVKEHEPFIALDGKEDGLFFYRKIAADAMKYLKSGGSIFLEIGNTQAADVKDILSKAGYKNINVYRDLCGNDRVVSAERSVLQG